MPEFLTTSLEKLQTGTYTHMATALTITLICMALSVFAWCQVSALPMVDGKGHVVDFDSKFDAINLSGENHTGI